ASRGLAVKRQEVVSRLAEATHRGDTSDALMRAMPVVMMIPARQHRRARGRMMVRDAVGPFAQRRLNEALGFAVGLRAIGAREAVVQAQLAAGGGEALRAKCRAVVGEHAPDGDAQGSEVVHARAYEGDGTVPALIGFHLREADARVVIDGDEQILPADSVDAIARVAGNAVAHAHNAGQVLGVDMQQVSGMRMLVANTRFTGRQARPVRQSGARQDPPYRARGRSQGRGYP